MVQSDIRLAADVHNTRNRQQTGGSQTYLRKSGIKLMTDDIRQTTDIRETSYRLQLDDI